MAYNNGLPRKPRQPRIQCICGVCGKPFETVASRIPLGGGKVCSIACRTASLRRPLEDTFWPKVNKTGPIPAHRPELGPCWEWIGKRHRNGYGQVGARPSTTGGGRLAHR